MRACLRLTACLLCLTWATAAHAWEIARFDVTVAIAPDSTADVTETIVASFDEPRHGIYRDIPIHYTDRAGQHFRLRLRVLSLLDDQGHPWPYRLETTGRYQRIRIGDPSRVVDGQQVYEIRYRVSRGAVRLFPDHDECYWNLTGNEWAVPIRQIRAEIRLPQPVQQLRAVAYVGAYGSTEQLRELELRPNGVVIAPTRALGNYEGVTAAVGWEKGIVHPPSAGQVVVWWAQDNWIYGLPLVVLAVMLWLWSVKGRDPRLPRSRVVEYQPPAGLTPAEAGTLFDQRVDLRDITSTVIDLAVRGYLRIEPEAGGVLHRADYQLVNLKPWADDPALKPHERLILDGLFDQPLASVRLSDLDETFYQHLPAIRDTLYTTLIQTGQLDGNPDQVRHGYLIGGVALGLVLWWGLRALHPWHQLPPLPILFAAISSGAIVCALSASMPRRTVLGAATTDQVLGFVEFLQRTDQDRIRRMNDPSLFERCLPYALAFGVAARWAKLFEGIYTTPPSWYVTDHGGFSSMRFTHELDRTTSRMQTSFTSQPRASGGSSGSWGGGGFGGGSSGGGGGGGGGGSW